MKLKLKLKLKLVVLATLSLTGCWNQSAAPDFEASELTPAGGMTAANLSSRSFVYPGANVDRMTQLDFWTGFSLFRDPWVIAPSSTKDRDGLGPLFNTRSCISCHKAGGRAEMAKEGESIPTALVIRLGSTTSEVAHADPIYGGQIQPRAIKVFHGSKQNVTEAEAWLELTTETLVSQYDDGEPYELVKPNYRLTRLRYGELAPHVGLSPRHAPNVFGMGLLDAIDEQDLLAQEEPDDTDGDGISAKYNRVLDVVTGEMAVGRFGFKAKQPNLHQQVAAAFRDDIGITNRLFADESCTQSQSTCSQVAAQTKDTQVEIPNPLLNLVSKFNALLAVPPARNLNSKKAQAGRALFYQLRCQACHTPSYTTASDYPITALAGQEIWPYTDLALHDMGPALADGVIEFEANGREWRTPPLWGIGLQKRYTGELRLLHDGRARTIEEAILWHGGEAESSQQQFVKLTQQERGQLVAFLNAI